MRLCPASVNQDAWTDHQHARALAAEAPAIIGPRACTCGELSQVEHEQDEKGDEDPDRESEGDQPKARGARATRRGRAIVAHVVPASKSAVRLVRMQMVTRSPRPGCARMPHSNVSITMCEPNYGRYDAGRSRIP